MSPIIDKKPFQRYTPVRYGKNREIETQSSLKPLELVCLYALPKFVQNSSMVKGIPMKIIGVESVERQLQILIANLFPSADIDCFLRSIPPFRMNDENTVVLLDWRCLGAEFSYVVQRLQWEICIKRSMFSVWLQGTEEPLHIKQTLSVNGLNERNILPPPEQETSTFDFQGDKKIRISIARIEERGEENPKQNEVPATIFDALVMMYANPGIHFGEELLLRGSKYRIRLGGEALLSIKTIPRGTTGKRCTQICANPENRVPHGMPAIYLQPQN